MIALSNLISISEMAKLHGITRQTLIYYDEIDLFKPMRVDPHGYRFYSEWQIPYLREICFLKSVGISLKEIVHHFQQRNPQHEIELLREQKHKLREEMERLSMKSNAISQRLSLYEEAVDASAITVHEPFLRSFDNRRVLFREYMQPIDKDRLHLTLMSIWKEICQKGMVSSSSFGSIIRCESAKRGTPLAGAGSCVFLPFRGQAHDASVRIPAGQYVCMYKYGMPYDMTHVNYLLEWIQQNGYQLVGDIVDVCLLDTTFYQQDTAEDFCMLQAPVEYA